MCIHGKNDLDKESKNLARSENNLKIIYIIV